VLPFDQTWYRRIIGFAVVLGIAGGVLGLLYLGATGAVIDLFFDDAGTEPWSGEWWWIPLVAGGGLIVAALRQAWNVPDKVPGGVALIEAADVDHRTAPQWVAISAVSAVVGASLGPSFALVLMGGGLGSWIVSRRWAEPEAAHDYTLTGIAGGFGAAFTSPVLGAFLVSELAPTPKQRYAAAIVPQLIAATVGFVIFYAVAGRTFLGIYELPDYEFEIIDMAIAAALGVLAAAVMAVFVGVIIAVRWATGLVSNRYVLGVVGGGIVGFIAFSLPLTLGAGQSQLGTVVEGASTFSIGLLLAVLIAKMAAMALSLAVGFMGGNVFPMIFMGGTAGVIVHLIVPDIPAALAVSCMLAAVPGSYLRAPISMTFIAAIAVSLDPRTTAPVAVSVITSFLLVSIIRYVIANRKQAAAASDVDDAPAAAT
jgi:H+/Cl- antiporter ClcA